MSQPAILPGALVGRDGELGFLQDFCRQAAVSGGALFLSGDPGVGKTALVNALAARHPRRARWWCAWPARSSRRRSAFPGSTRRCSRCLATSANSTPPTGTRCGWPSVSEPACTGAAAGIQRRAGPAAHAAARVPVLLIVDDLPWIDRASACVLSFAARRLGGSRAGLLAACRTGAESYFDRGGLWI